MDRQDPSALQRGVLITVAAETLSGLYLVIGGLTDQLLVAKGFRSAGRQIVGKMTDQERLSLPTNGAVNELVEEARRIKATNPRRKWTATQ